MTERRMVHSWDAVTATNDQLYLIKTHSFLLDSGEATDDQPFVSKNDVTAQYDPNLYLYSVSVTI